MNKFFRPILSLLGLGMTMISCDSLIYDDLADCPTGVYVNFFSQTPCASDSAYLGDVSKLHLFAFENDSVLADYKVLDNPKLTKEYSTLMNLPAGAYKFYGWAGADAQLFDLAQFTKGVTKKDDLMLALKTQNGIATNLEGHRLFAGQNNKVVVVKDPAQNGTDYQYTAVNLLEKTNRVNIELVIDESIYRSVADTKLDDFALELFAGNTKSNINGTLPKAQPQVTYEPAKVTKNADGKSMVYSYNILDIQAGYNSVLRLRNLQKNVEIKDDKNQDIDLVAYLLAASKNIDPRCTHDFNIKIVVKDKCADCGTYMCQVVMINGWEVHSYIWKPGFDL